MDQDTQGPGGDRRTVPAKLTAAQRRQQALELRLGGATYEQIAKAVGYSHKSSASKAVAQALRDIPRESAEAVRDLELARLDEMQLRLTARFRQGDLDVVAKMLRVMDHRAKLTGSYQLPEGAGDLGSVTAAFGGLLASAVAFAQEHQPDPIPEMEPPKDEAA